MQAANIATDGMFIADNSLKVRFKDAETQLKARDVIENTLGEGYITALKKDLEDFNNLVMGYITALSAKAA